MKCFALLQLIFIPFFPAFAQSNSNETDRKIFAIPEEQTRTTASIAEFINANFTSDVDKVRAAYTWVVHNIKYDTDSMYAINWNMGGSLKITESFRRRKGVCENFAGIFIDIVKKTGLQGITIDGYTKQAGLINKTGHTWSAVNVSDSWYLFDPTWDKDRLHDYNHFMATPSAFSYSHMPFDPLWQFADTPVTHREFHGRSPIKRDLMINHVDSVKAFMRLSELDKLEATARRIQKTDKISDLVRNRIAFLQMQIATVYEEKDMHLYNAAVLDLNKATEAYNKFVSKISTPDNMMDMAAEYKKSMEPALSLLKMALNRIADIGKFIPNHQYDPTGLKMRVLEIADKIRRAKPQPTTLSKT